jgi:hypothetical protein
MFMNVRSIEEYKMELIIDPYKCSDVPLAILNGIVMIVPTKIQDLAAEFASQFKP